MDYRIHTKDSIKARMFNHISTLWSVRNTDNTDPVISLLIEALSAEIFRLAGEMDSIESRILEKVASALTPAIGLSAYPAHAILHAAALEGCCITTPQHEFAYKNPQLIRKYNLKRLLFSPLFPTQIINGDILYMTGNQEFYNIVRPGSKELLARTLSPNPVLNGNIRLGIRIGREIPELSHLSFYFDLLHTEDKGRYLSQLSHSRWSVGHTPLKIIPGLHLCDQSKDSLPDKYDVDQTICRNIIQLYDSHYITLNEPLHLQELRRETFPDDLRPLFEDSFVAGFKESLLWLTIELPPCFTPEIISQLRVCINAFPIANRFTAKASRYINAISTIIPLPKNAAEYVIAVQSVSDSSGRFYQEIRMPGNEGQSAGTYAVRRGGCERFNATDARNQIQRLIDLLYDESAAFSGLDRDAVKENIERLVYYISLLEKRVQERAPDEEPLSYVLINPDKRDENRNVTVSYVLTSGAPANDVAATEVLTAGDADEIKQDSIHLLTRTRGGRPTPSLQQKLDFYKFSLISHGSVYTREDIRNFCLSHYKEYIASIEVCPGFRVGEASGEGFIRTLDIHITPTDKLKENDPADFSRDLLNDLRACSPESFNYRIIIQ